MIFPDPLHQSSSKLLLALATKEEIYQVAWPMVGQGKQKNGSCLAMPTILPERTHIQRKDGIIYLRMPIKRRQILLVQSGESNRNPLQWQSSAGSNVDHRRAIGKLGFNYVQPLCCPGVMV